MPTNDKVTTKWQENTLCSESRWQQKGLWQSARGAEKSTEEGNDKGNSRDVRGNKFVSEKFLGEVQLVDNCKPVNSVNWIDVWSVVFPSLFFSWGSNLFL